MAAGILYGPAPVPFSGYRSYRGYGDLSQADLDACEQALTALCSSAATATQTATPSVGQSITAWLLGSQSSVQAAQSDAAAGQTLCNVMTAKLAAWQADPTQATQADAQDFVRACQENSGAAGNAALYQTMKLVDPTNAAKTIASDTASDIASGVKSVVGGIPGWIWILGVAGLAVYLGWKPFKRS